MYKIIGGDHKEYGPASADELRAWIADGRLSAQSLAQVEGTGQWRPLAAYPEFADALRAQACYAPAASAAEPPLAAAILARRPQVRLGACLAGSAKLLRDNFALLFGAAFLVWAVGMLSTLNPFSQFTAPLYAILQGVFYGGLCLVFLNRIRGRPAVVGDAFSGFRVAFAQLFLVGFISLLLVLIALTPCCLILPGIYLFVAWLFGVPLVADKRLEFWSAMELSRKVVSRVWFQVFALFLLAFLPALSLHLFIQVKLSLAMIPLVHNLTAAGPPDFGRLLEIANQAAEQAPRAAGITPTLLLASRLVFLLNLPFALGALLHAYENLFGARSAPTA